MDRGTALVFRVVRFYDPYERSVIGKLTCGDSTYDWIQVGQK
jgi:hypothetical protein